MAHKAAAGIQSALPPLLQSHPVPDVMSWPAWEGANVLQSPGHSRWTMVESGGTRVRRCHPYRRDLAPPPRLTRATRLRRIRGGPKTEEGVGHRVPADAYSWCAELGSAT